MASPTTNAVDTQRQTYGGAGFDVPDYDLEKTVPDAYAGTYEAKILAVKWRMTQSAPPRPMIIVELKITGTEDESAECQKSVGSTVSEFITIANSRDGNMGKQRLRALKEALDIQTDLTRMNTETVKKLHDELKGRQLPIWIDNKPDRDGNIRARISYAAPQSIGPMVGEDEEEPEEAEEEAPRSKAKKAGKSARR